jgi:cell division septation protein DedD
VVGSSLLFMLAGLGSALHERAGDTLAATAPLPSSIAPAQPGDLPRGPAAVLENAPSVIPESPARVAGPAPVESPAGDPDPAEAPAGSSSPLPSPAAPAQIAALEGPSATATGDAGHYWVEYGVFLGEGYARRLQRALADHGLAAVIVQTHAPDGRVLVRVRSVALADYPEAREVATRAGRALGIGPLVHRSLTLPPQPPASMPVISFGRGEQRYWVQFGAFPRAGQAQRLADALRGGGIDAAISTARAASGRPLFLVRSLELPDRGSAVALAHRGRQAANVDYLIGRSVEPRHAAVALTSRLASKD